jgi:hypothetical protein
MSDFEHELIVDLSAARDEWIDEAITETTPTDP